MRGWGSGRSAPHSACAAVESGGSVERAARRIYESFGNPPANDRMEIRESGMESEDSRSRSLDPTRATLHPQGDDGIDAHRTARRNVTGDPQHQRE